MVGAPRSAGMREFGYQRFNSGMVRHLSLRTAGELRVMLVQNAVSDAYCSSGYYNFPDLPMADKDWQGADLVFDIDSKDLALPCRAVHTVLKCAACGAPFLPPDGAGEGPAACPGCGSPRHDSRSLPCRDCVAGAKKEVAKLLRVLGEDLAVLPEDCAVYFSGNEGFHVHVDDERFRGIGSGARGEIADYVAFRGAVPERFGMARSGAAGLPEAGEAGWRGRVAAALLGPKSARPRLVREAKAAGYGAFAARLAGLQPSLGARIDRNVTTDVHRIFRLPGSLSGKSGLAKAPCGRDLDGFDPYRDACLVDGDPVDVVARSPVRFRLRGRGFGPYDGEAVTVPRFAAAYMICKGLATAPPRPPAPAPR